MSIIREEKTLISGPTSDLTRNFFMGDKQARATALKAGMYGPVEMVHYIVYPLTGVRKVIRKKVLEL
jgi:hypothetical protein